VTLQENDAAYRALSWWLANGEAFLPWIGALLVLMAVAVAGTVWAIRAVKLAVLVTAAAAAAEWWRAGGWARLTGRGRSPEYEAVMRSGGWRRRRRQAIRRAGRRCEQCGERGPLDVHHVTYDRLGREAPGDVIALCPTCHARTHRR
jgi:hypothetical protein